MGDALAFDLGVVLDARRTRGLLGMEQACFGTDDSVALTAALGHLLAGCGFELETILDYAVSIGIVVTVAATNGDRMIVKVFPSWHDPEFLSAANDVRRRLLVEGYPAPEPLTDVVPLAAGHAWVEKWLAAPAPADQDSVASLLGSSLADHLVRCWRADPDPALRRSWQTFDPPVGIWRNRLRPELDPTRRPEGAEWILAIAEEARALVDAAPGPQVVGHVDWRPDNVRFDADGRLAAVYDWDSIQLTHRVHVLAGACSRPEQTTAVLAAFEEATGEPLPRVERLAVAGRLVWKRAISARLEHADDVPLDQRRWGPRLEDDLVAFTDAV